MLPTNHGWCLASTFTAAFVTTLYIILDVHIRTMRYKAADVNGDVIYCHNDTNH